MTYQWLNQSAACPVVEFHDIRTEKFKSDRYLSLVERRLRAPLVAAGAVALGEFRVENHPDWLFVMRGFASMPARRKALTAFHASEDWAAQRRESADLVRNEQVGARHRSQGNLDGRLRHGLVADGGLVRVSDGGRVKPVVVQFAERDDAQ